MDEELDFSKLKKKNRKINIPKDIDSVIYSELYDYDNNLKRLYDYMKLDGFKFEPTLKLILPDIKLIKIGNKTGLCNFDNICLKMKRSQTHVKSFIDTELGTISSINISKILLLKGKFSTEQVKTIIKSYIKTFIQCNLCKSYNTELNKNTKSCLDCFIKKTYNS